MITGTYGTEGNDPNGSGVYQINPMLDFCGIFGGAQLETIIVSDDREKTEVGGVLQ